MLMRKYELPDAYIFYGDSYAYKMWLFGGSKEELLIFGTFICFIYVLISYFQSDLTIAATMNKERRGLIEKE